MINKIKGDIALKFKSMNLVLRPSFSAIAEIESATAKSIIQLIEEFPVKKLKFEEIVSIIHAANISNIERQEIINLIEEEGIIEVLPVLVEFLLIAVGEVKPATPQ